MRLTLKGGRGESVARSIKPETTPNNRTSDRFMRTASAVVERPCCRTPTPIGGGIDPSIASAGVRLAHGGRTGASWTVMTGNWATPCASFWGDPPPSSSCCCCGCSAGASAGGLGSEGGSGSGGAGAEPGAGASTTAGVDRHAPIAPAPRG